MIDWHLIREDLTPDGALRDIYVFDANVEIWRRAIHFVSETYRCEYSVGGQPLELPDLLQVFHVPRTASHLLQVDLEGSGSANCHFFSPDELEFDLNPGDWNERNFLVLEAFMVGLGRTVQREVLLTHENMREAVIARFVPVEDAVRVAPAGG